MKLSRRVAIIASAAALSLTGTVALSPSASAATGTKSLASVLLADTSGFDHNKADYDILKAAVLAVLKAKPASKVGVLTDGNVALTAFLPNDLAFRRLVYSLTGNWITSERRVFNAVAGLGIPTVEKVLLYHVVPGATVTAAQAVTLDGKYVRTALGNSFRVKVTHVHGKAVLTLVDKDRNANNPVVVRVNINKGNKQIAHGLNRVLRPADLPPLAH